jgi:hypothetical protein
VHETIFKAFLAGLAEDGMEATEEQVLYGYLGSLLARATFTALPLEQITEPGNAANLAMFEHRVLLTRALVDLVSPVV